MIPTKVKGNGSSQFGFEQSWQPNRTDTSLAKSAAMKNLDFRSSNSAVAMDTSHGNDKLVNGTDSLLQCGNSFTHTVTNSPLQMT